jgi:hypothetical protein
MYFGRGERSVSCWQPSVCTSAGGAFFCILEEVTDYSLHSPVSSSIPLFPDAMRPVQICGIKPAFPVCELGSLNTGHV